MSEVTRRTFVGTAAGAAGAAALAGSSAIAGTTDRNDPYAPERFRPHLGSHFHIAVGNNDRVDAVLAKVEVIQDAPKPQFRAPVSLIFVTQERALQQDRYTLEHDQLGRLNLLLVPIGKGTNGYRHQVIFG